MIHDLNLNVHRQKIYLYLEDHAHFFSQEALLIYHLITFPVAITFEATLPVKAVKKKKIELNHECVVCSSF